MEQLKKPMSLGEIDAYLESQPDHACTPREADEHLKRYKETFGEAFPTMFYGGDLDVCCQVIGYCLEKQRPVGDLPKNQKS